MRHLHSGRKLGVSSPHRKALLRSLTLALIENDTIQTLPSRAKELRWYADRLVTLAKRGDLASRRQIVQILGSTETNRPGENRVRLAVERIYSSLVPRFKNRNGGYTQLIRLSPRRAGDNAEMCIMRYIPAPDPKGTKQKKKETEKPSKKIAAATKDEENKNEKHKKTVEAVENNKLSKTAKKGK